MDVLIRPPRDEDGDGLALAARDLAEQYAAVEPQRFAAPEHDALVAYHHEALAQPARENRLWLVAESDGAAVGEAVAELHEPSPYAAIEPGLDLRRRRVRLEYLAVQARFRSRGIGGRLLDAVEDWARQRGAELIVTDTNLRSNLGAVEFYERHGYERQAVILRKPLT